MQHPIQTAQLTDDEINAVLARYGVDSATIPTEVRRPVTLAAQLVEGIVGKLGWNATPLLAITLWARRTSLGGPDMGDIVAQPTIVDHDGALEAVGALRRLVTERRPPALPGRVFAGLVVTAEHLDTDVDLWEGRTNAEAEALHADLVASGRGKQSVLAVGALVDGWRFQYAKPRHGDTNVVAFPPGEPWPDRHDLAEVVIMATLPNTNP